MTVVRNEQDLQRNLVEKGGETWKKMSRYSV
jgi:hypothetical protein